MTTTWQAPPARAARTAAGRSARERTPRSALSTLTTTGRDPLGILDAQNGPRVPELVPIRIERMSASPFAFYRGAAAVMAADLARDPHSGILVGSSGDAHVANFGFYASPLRTLVFDLNDFDEAAWAPWEWDVKRLVASIVIAGQETGRDEAVVRATAMATVKRYATSLAAGRRHSPLHRYYEHFDAQAGIGAMDPASANALRAAIRDAQKRTSERAARRLTEVVDGRVTFVEQPPTMTHVTDEIEQGLHQFIADYLATANVDVRMVVQQYVASDMARRVVGVGSVGTRCYLTAFQDGDRNVLLLQAKQAGRSVLAEYGRIHQPESLTEHIAANGEGARVVAMQRILQAVSDPFLGHLQANGNDYYVRQFHDMKGGIDIETLEDRPFRRYAKACATVLARAHGQSPAAPEVAGYIGGGREVAEAIVDWSFAYADLARADHTLARETSAMSQKSARNVT